MARPDRFMKDEEQGVAPLAERLRSVVDLRIPGFERAVPPGRVGQLNFRERDSHAWFAEFVELCLSAIGRRYLPVYRLADGEFGFAVGHRIPYTPPGQNPLLHYGREVGSMLKHWRFGRHLSGPPGQRHLYEEYAGAELRGLREDYARYLREIARDGALAFTFLRTADRWAEQYHAPMFQWLDRHDIRLDERNYYPFYFVYGLLNGPLRRIVFGGRRILVVNRLDDARKARFTVSLKGFGAESVEFLPISPNGAMHERVDLDRIRGPVDLALVGAGIGAANILVQMRALGTLCLDAGHCLEILVDPSRAGERDFTVPDTSALWDHIPWSRP